MNDNRLRLAGKTHQVFTISFLTIYYLKTMFSMMDTPVPEIENFKLLLNAAILLLSIYAIIVERSIALKLFAITIWILFFAEYATLGRGVYFNYVQLSSLLLILRDLNKESLTRCLLTAALLSSLLSLPFSLLVDEFYQLDDRFGYRLKFYFDNPNSLAAYCLALVCTVALFLDSNKRITNLTLVLTVFFWVFSLYIIYLTYSRTVMLLVSLLTFAFLLTRFLRKRPKNYFALYFLAFISILCIQWVGAMKYRESGFLVQIDHYLSGRFFFSSRAIELYSYPHFFHGTAYSEQFPIDFFFINLFYEFGWLIGAILILFFLYAIKKSKANNFEWCVLFIFSLTLMTETYFTMLFLNPILFIFFRPRHEGFKPPSTKQ